MKDIAAAATSAAAKSGAFALKSTVVAEVFRSAAADCCGFDGKNKYNHYIPVCRSKDNHKN